MLLDEVLKAGTERGLTRFRAYVLAENHRMLRLLARHTRIIERKSEQGEIDRPVRAALDSSEGGRSSS